MKLNSKQIIGLAAPIAVCVAFAMGASTGFAADAKAEKLDVTALQLMPVWEGGRAMPFDSFARSTVEDICGRQKPKLGIKDKGTTHTWDSRQMELARQLFPDGADRKFTPAELVFSWIVENDKWDEVPFLLAERDVREMLKVDKTNSKGEALHFVSPAQVEQAIADRTPFFNRLSELEQARQQGGMGKTVVETPVDKKLRELFVAFRTYQLLGVGPAIGEVQQRALQHTLGGITASLGELAEPLALFQQSDKTEKLGKDIDIAVKASQQLDALSEKPDATISDASTSANALRLSTENLAREFAKFREMLKTSPPKEVGENQLAAFGKLLDQLAQGTAGLAMQARNLEEGLLESGHPLHVIPAMNAEALEADRAAETDDNPWLDLQSLLFADTRTLSAYPAKELVDVRSKFTNLAAVYRARDNHRRPDEFAHASRAFTRSVQELGDRLEETRSGLAANPDKARLVATRYPTTETIAKEVRYNTLDPFFWSWIINLTALFCFALSFGVMRKPMFWAGVVILAGGVLWSIFGFYLRVAVTKWAPVTNMYETVIYVPFFATLLGLWFAMIPATWGGLKNAWRMTAAPLTPEDPGFDDDALRLMSEPSWRKAQVAVLLPRLGLSLLVFLMLAWFPYAAGGRTIINLSPLQNAGAGGVNGNDILTWGVGLIVLAAAVWQVPRALLTLLLSFVTVPLTLARGGHDEKPVMPQLYARWPFVFGAAFIAFMGTYVAWYSPVLDGKFTALQPVLRDNFWLLIHVLTIVSSYGAGLLAWILGNITLFYYIFGRYRDPIEPHDHGPGYRPAVESVEPVAYTRQPPEEVPVLAGYTYRAMQVAVLLLIAGTILGGLWADVSWGRFWGWDPKEVWALISGLVYLAILHGRYAGWFGNFGLAVGSIIGATAIAMSWYGVNFWLGVGLHAYGFGTGGMPYVISFVAANWLLVVLPAALRYGASQRVPAPAPAQVDDEVVHT